MANEKKVFTVGFTRFDGVTRHAQVPEGTKISSLLKKFGYEERELAGLIGDVRVNNNPLESMDYVLEKDDVISVLPNAKGGR
jgi:molybdopterin converting factor small subunit